MIHLTRRQSITVASSLIALFFVGMWALSQGSSKSVIAGGSRTSSPTPSQYPTPQQGAQFLLNDFHRSEVKNGRTIWEVKAKKGEYFPDKQMAQIFDAAVWLFRSESEKVLLNAPEAELLFNGTAMSKVFFPGTVHVVYNDMYIVDTSVATYEKSSETIVSDHPVKLSSDLIDVEGARFVANSAENSIIISGGVKTVIKPQGKNKR